MEQPQSLIPSLFVRIKTRRLTGLQPSQRRGDHNSTLRTIPIMSASTSISAYWRAWENEHPPLTVQVHVVSTGTKMPYKGAGTNIVGK